MATDSESTYTPPPDTPAEELRQESFGQLLGELSADTSHLVKQEINLARAELAQKARAAGRGVGMLVGAAIAAALFLQAFTALLIIILDAFLDLWLAALIVTLLWLIIAAALAAAGRAALKQAAPPVPEQTVETMKENVEWAKHPTRSART